MHNQFLLVDAYFSIGRRLYKSNQLPLTRAQPLVAPGLGASRDLSGGGGVLRGGGKTPRAPRFPGASRPAAAPLAGVLALEKATPK